MPKNDNDEKQKHPTEMTTDEAIDYVFAPEIADALRQEARKGEPPEDLECDEQTV
jgi:hypothetical protein